MIDDWMPTLKMKLAEVSGIEQVHDYDDLPASILVFPCMIVLPVDGDGTFSAGGVNILRHRVRVTLFVAGQVLPEAHSLAVPFIEKVVKKICANMTLDGTVTRCSFPKPPEKLYSGPGGLKYGDKELTGIIFNLDVKEKTDATITVSA